jgi:hypothetical protein
VKEFKGFLRARRTGLFALAAELLHLPGKPAGVEKRRE